MCYDALPPWVNDQSPSTKLGCEMEKENKFAFLDTLLSKEYGRLCTSVDRKLTFIGLGLLFGLLTPQIQNQ